MATYTPKDRARLEIISKAADAWVEQTRVRNILLESFSNLYNLYLNFETTSEEELENSFDAVKIAISIYKSL